MTKSARKGIEVSSDAVERLQTARNWVLAYPADTEILIVANSTEAASDFQLSVVSSSAAWFGIKHLTLNVLASRLAQHALAASGSAPASNLTFTAVVARAIHSLQSEGALSYFERVATRPGFPIAVAKTLEELRMNEVAADSIALLDRGGKDLAAIANLVEQELLESKLSDRAALYKAAIDLISSPENAPYARLPLLLLDVAIRGRLESRLIQELAAGSPRVLATVPQGDERTVSSLEESLRCKRGKPRATSGTNSLSLAKQHLFENSSPPITPLDSSVTIQNWPGEPRECVEIVRGIQAEAERGVPFDQMAVLLNSPGEYRSHLEEAFSRAEIPAYFVRGTTAPDPAGRAMLALLACAADGLSAKRFAEYLSLGQVPAPAAKKDVESQWVAPTAELAAITTEAENNETANETEEADLVALREYALPLIGRLADLPVKANWNEWLAHLRELAVNALRQPGGVMATLAELEPMSSVGPVDLYEVQLVLEARLHDLGVEPPRRRYGRVFIGPVDAARGLSFQVVFIPGLAERIFPRKIVEDPILPDVQRKDTELPTRRDRVEVERLALRMAIGTARDRVYLSYPRIDVQQSRPRVPSFYALEALRAAEGILPGFEEIASRAESTTRARLGWPAPERPNAAIDEAEYDLALLANLVESNKEEATGAAHYLLTANTHLARALRARSRRWLRRWTPNDGLVDVDELARASLTKHQFSARPFSARALQNYASCPYRFLLIAILRFDFRQERAAIEVIDPLTRGSLFHDTQFEVLTGLRAAGLLPLQAASLGKAFDLVDRGLGRLASDYEDRLAPAIPRVWHDGINSIRADLREWLRRMTDEHAWIPDKFELSFGLSDRGPREADPASVADPVGIIGDLKLRGYIDMVERQGDRFRVTDHKTGKARADNETIVGGGKYLQPLLYALACQELLDARVESGRLYYCTADGGYEERVVPLDEENLHILNTVLIAIRQGLADAFLPAAPDHDACNWCEFLAVCGTFEETRTRIKPRDRLVQLKALRDLP